MIQYYRNTTSPRGAKERITRGYIRKLQKALTRSNKESQEPNRRVRRKGL